MMRIGFRRLGRETRGIAAVEFALISPVFFLVVFGFVDLAYTMYVRAMLEGTLQDAARLTTVGNQTAASVDTFVKNRMKSFGDHIVVTSTTTSYYEYSGIGKPEKIKQDTAPFGEYNEGDCWEDLNGNGIWDHVAGVDGVGGSDDIVYYQTTATFPAIVPIYKFMNMSNIHTVSATTVLRNQPFASQYVPQTICSG